MNAKILSTQCWNRLLDALPEQAVEEGIERWLGWPHKRVRTAHLCQFDGDYRFAYSSDTHVRGTYRVRSLVELANAILEDEKLWSLDDMPYELWLCRYDSDPQLEEDEDREGRLTEEQLTQLRSEYVAGPHLLIQDLTCPDMIASNNAFTFFFEDEMAWRHFVLPRVHP